MIKIRLNLSLIKCYRAEEWIPPSWPTCPQPKGEMLHIYLFKPKNCILLLGNKLLVTSCFRDEIMQTVQQQVALANMQELLTKVIGMTCS